MDLFSDFKDALADYLKSIGQLFSGNRFWKFLVLPIILVFTLYYFLYTLSSSLVTNGLNWLVSLLPWLDASWISGSVGSWIHFIFFLVFGFFVFRYVLFFLASPFMSALARDVQDDLNAGDDSNVIPYRDSSILGDLSRGARLSIRNFIIELCLTVVLFFVSFIPIVGLASAALLFIIQSYFAGFAAMDYALERSLSFKDSIRFVGKNKFYTIGIGMIFMLSLLVPFIGTAVVLPWSTVAASRGVNKRLQGFLLEQP